MQFYLFTIFISILKYILLIEIQTGGTTHETGLVDFSKFFISTQLLVSKYTHLTYFYVSIGDATLL